MHKPLVSIKSTNLQFHEFKIIPINTCKFELANKFITNITIFHLLLWQTYDTFDIEIGEKSFSFTWNHNCLDQRQQQQQ